MGFLQDLDELLGCGCECGFFVGNCRLLHIDFANPSNAFPTLANRKTGPRGSNGPHDQHAAEQLISLRNMR